MTLEQLLQSIVGDLPAAGAVIVVVLIFVRHIKLRDDSFIAAIERIEARQEKVTDSAESVIEDNTRALIDNAHALGRNTEALQKAERQLEPTHGRSRPTED